MDEIRTTLNNGAESTLSIADGGFYNGLSGAMQFGFTGLSSRYNGDLSEIITFDRELTTSEDSEVKNYLNGIYTIY